MEDSTWFDLYRSMEAPRPARVLTGFNVNLDRIIPVTRDLLESLPADDMVPAGFRERLHHAMETCTADEIFVRDTEQYRQFAARFTGTDAIGGQAGIASMHLKSVGAPAVICIAPFMSGTARAMLQDAGVLIPPFLPAGEVEPETIHLVFEYSPGLVPLARGTVPRNNRFIVSPVHDPGTVILGESAMAAFLNAAAEIDRAFLSGYRYLTSDREFGIAADQLRAAKGRNPHLKIHIEWVSIADQGITGRLIRYILPVSDSLGVNEHELGLLYRCLEPVPAVAGSGISPTPVDCVNQAMILCTRTGLARLHLHTFGYYLLVCRNSPDPEGCRDALLLASQEAVRSSKGTEPGFVPEGRAAVDAIARAFGPEQSPGIVQTGTCTLIVIPSLIVKGITKTAGMGDRISSIAFAADPF